MIIIPSCVEDRKIRSCANMTKQAPTVQELGTSLRLWHQSQKTKIAKDYFFLLADDSKRDSFQKTESIGTRPEHLFLYEQWLVVGRTKDQLEFSGCPESSR